MSIKWVPVEEWKSEAREYRYIRVINIASGHVFTAEARYKNGVWTHSKSLEFTEESGFRVTDVADYPLYDTPEKLDLIRKMFPKW